MNLQISKWLEEIMKTYFGYRYEPDGRYHAVDRLSGEQEMFDYLKEKNGALKSPIPKIMW